MILNEKEAREHEKDLRDIGVDLSQRTFRRETLRELIEMEKDDTIKAVMFDALEREKTEPKINRSKKTK